MPHSRKKRRRFSPRSASRTRRRYIGRSSGLSYGLFHWCWLGRAGQEEAERCCPTYLPLLAADFRRPDRPRNSSIFVSSMPKLTIHPTTCLIVWLLFLVVVQFMSGTTLVVTLLLLPALGTYVLQRGSRLIWRARWLLISMLAIFSWGIPGDPLWNLSLIHI